MLQTKLIVINKKLSPWLLLGLIAASCGSFMGNPSSRKDSDKGGGGDTKPQNIALTDAEIKSVFSPASGTFLGTAPEKSEPQSSCVAKDQLFAVKSELEFAKATVCLIGKRNAWNKNTTFRVKIKPDPDAPTGAPSAVSFHTKAQIDGSKASIQFCFNGKKPDYDLSWQRNGKDLSGYVTRIQDQKSGEPLYSVGSSTSDGKSFTIDLFGVRRMHYTFKVADAAVNVTMYEESEYTSHKDQIDRRFVHAIFNGDKGSLKWLQETKYNVEQYYSTDVQSGKLNFDDKFAQIASRLQSGFSSETGPSVNESRVSIRLPNTFVASKSAGELQKGGSVYVSKADLPSWENEAAMPKLANPEWNCETDETIDIDEAEYFACASKEVDESYSCSSSGPLTPGGPSRPAGEEDLTD